MADHKQAVYLDEGLQSIVQQIRYIQVQTLGRASMIGHSWLNRVLTGVQGQLEEFVLLAPDTPDPHKSSLLSVFQCGVNNF